jgi:hypothetical protein
MLMFHQGYKMSFKQWSAAQTAASKANSATKADAATVKDQPMAKPAGSAPDDTPKAKP